MFASGLVVWDAPVPQYHRYWKTAKRGLQARTDECIWPMSKFELEYMTSYTQNLVQGGVSHSLLTDQEEMKFDSFCGPLQHIVPTTGASVKPRSPWTSPSRPAMFLQCIHIWPNLEHVPILVSSTMTCHPISWLCLWNKTAVLSTCALLTCTSFCYSIDSLPDRQQC
jgi:hypothetical protein